MKKCPHCGMNIRDNVEVCGYCGGEISPQPATIRRQQRRTGSAAERPAPAGPKKPAAPRLMNRKAKRVKRRRAGSLQFSSRANRC